MSGYVAIIILTLGILLFWFGYEVGSGRHTPNPKDKFFPLFGRNIDYVLGAAGILAGLGMFVLAFGAWANLPALNYVASALILLGIVRAYLPPEKFGPGWYRRYHKKNKAYRSQQAKRAAKKRSKR